MEKISASILKFLRLDNLIEHVSGFLEARVDLMQTEIREDVSKAIARGVVTVVLFLVAFLCLIFLSIGFAHLLNRLEGSTDFGYWVVAGVYGATFLLLMVFRKNILQYFEQQFSVLIKRKVN